MNPTTSALAAGLLAAVATLSYALDAAAYSVGPVKVPLALVLLLSANVFLLHEIVAKQAVSNGILRGVVIWLCIVGAWLLCTMYGDQRITDDDLRLVVYSASMIPVLWLATTPLHEPTLRGLLLGVTFATAIGFFRFVTFSGGDPSEHALGYWGIKYMPSTRNGDVFYPLIGIALALHYLHAARTPARRWAAIALALPLALAVVLSSSRGAWLGLALLLLVDAARTSRRSLAGLLLATVAVACVLALAFEAVPELGALLAGRAATLVSLDADAGGSNTERLQLLAAAGNASLDTLLGSGVGSFGERVGYTNLVGDAVNHAENLLLTVTVEQGIVGLLVYASLSLMLLRQAFRPDAIGNIAVVMLSHSLLNYELNSLFYWAMLAYALAQIPVHRPAGLSQRRSPPPPRAGFDPVTG